jgi:hypothetical protein
MGLAPIVTVDAPPRDVVFPSKSCQSAVKPGGIVKVVAPQEVLVQGKVTAVLSQTNKPAWPLACVMAHWNIPVGVEAEQSPPFGLGEHVHGPLKAAPIVHFDT